MNYFPFHVGDYLTATAHLSWLEDCAYRRLMDVYYGRESPIPADIAKACRLVRATTKDEREAVKVVLEEFFKSTDSGWLHARCEEEIQKARVLRDRAKSNGMKGGRKPKQNPDGTQPVISGLSKQNPDGTQTEPDPEAPNPNPNPNTSVDKSTATEVAPTPPVLPDAAGDPGGGLPTVLTASELTKAELWAAGKSLLLEQGLPKAQCGSFVGSLVKEYGDAVVIEAVRAAVLTTPADAKEYLKGACKTISGERKKAEPEWRAEQRNRTLQAVPNIADYGCVPPTQFFESEATNVIAIAVGR